MPSRTPSGGRRTLMNPVRFSLITMLALMAIVAAGCAGVTADDVGETPAAAGDAPSGLSPAGGLTPDAGDDGSVEATDGEIGDAGEAPSPDEGDPDVTDSPISCDFERQADAEVGQPYDQPLSASGGSGQFRFEAEGLPQGLFLSRSGAIAGTPEVAGGQTATITVIDVESGDGRNCKIDFEIRETIKVGASLLRESAKPVWVLTIGGTSGDMFYSWSFSRTEHLCGSTSAALAQTEGCPILPLHGKKIYLWRDEELPVKTEVTATATSSFAAPASALILFKPELPTTAIVPGTFGASNAGALLGVKSLKVRTMTGGFEHPGTDCDILIEFCTDAAMDHCVDDQLLDDEDDDFEGGNTDTFTNLEVPEGMTAEHRYIRITQTNDNCGENSGWHFRGVDVTVTYDDESEYRYYNPCVAKWMNKNDTIDFGPDDTAVCAKITTGDVSKAGTNDYINLQVRTRIDEDLDDLRMGSEGLSTGAPHFDPQWAEDHDLPRLLPLVIEWADYDDCERGDVDWYGDYVFDSNPFVLDPQARVYKGSDGDNGGWYLESFDVYVFQPAKLSEAGTVFHEKCEGDEWNYWMEEENTLLTPECHLDQVDAGAIDDDVGRN